MPTREAKVVGARYLTIRLSPEMHDAVVEAAAEEERTVASLIRFVLKAFLSDRQEVTREE